MENCHYFTPVFTHYKLIDFLFGNNKVLQITNTNINLGITPLFTTLFTSFATNSLLWFIGVLYLFVFD